MLNDVPLDTLAEYCFVIYLMLSVLCLIFYRPDFLNLTLSLIGFSIFHSPKANGFSNVIRTQSLLQTLFQATVFSLASDVVYLVANTTSLNSNIYPCDGGLELNLRRISLALSFISFFFRFSIIYVTWRSYKLSPLEKTKVIMSEGFTEEL